MEKWKCLSRMQHLVYFEALDSCKEPVLLPKARPRHSSLHRGTNWLSFPAGITESKWKLLAAPSPKCMLSAGRKTDGLGLWGVLGEFSSAGTGRKPLTPLSHPVCLERVEGSIPVYDGFLSHRSLDFYEALNKGQVHPQGSAAPRSLLTHLQIVYQFQILAIVCRCEGNRAFCRIIPVQFVKYVVCPADVCSLGSMCLYSSSHLQSCGQTCFGGLEGRMAVYIKWWCCNIVHVTKDREVTLPRPMENFGFF